MASHRPERRKHPRVPGEELPLLLEGDSRTPLRIRDLSRSGVSFYSERPLELMTKVRLSIEFPRPGGHPELASGEGVIVRCEQVSKVMAHYEGAIFFSDLDLRAKELIGEWVDQRLIES